MEAEIILTESARTFSANDVSFIVGGFMGLLIVSTILNWHWYYKQLEFKNSWRLNNWRLK